MKIWSKVTVFLLPVIVSMVSCVSLDDRVLYANEKGTTEVVGSVTVKFTSFQFLHIPNKKSIKTKAYNELMKAAQKEYSGNIDIRNISISGGLSGWEAVWVSTPVVIGTLGGLIFDMMEFSVAFGSCVSVGTALLANFQKITATGDVVYSDNTAAVLSRSETPIKRTSRNQSGVEMAMNNAAEVVMDSLSKNLKLAIVNVSSNDKELSEFVANELEYILVNSHFTVVDRSELNRIRSEQNFQLSGDVDDKTIVSIGKFAGADVVITGAVTGTGETRRLRLRALNTQTAQVMAVASERF